MVELVGAAWLKVLGKVTEVLVVSPRGLERVVVGRVVVGRVVKEVSVAKEVFGEVKEERAARDWGSDTKERAGSVVRSDTNKMNVASR